MLEKKSVKQRKFKLTMVKSGNKMLPATSEIGLYNKIGATTFLNQLKQSKNNSKYLDSVINYA